MLLPQELYKISVYDHNGALQSILQNWSRLEFHQRTNSPWNHQITLEFGYDDPALTTLRSFLPDYIITVHRTDPVTLVTTKVYEGFNVTIVDQVRANGGVIINLYGVGYTQLLQRRIVLPSTGEEYSNKTGAAETVIKGYVSDSAVGTLDPGRTFPGLVVTPDTAVGPAITYSARYINLLSLCETVSEQGGLDFGIYGGDEIGEFIFDARSVWGNDLREGNPAGNIPVIFSIERDNMLIPILSRNYSAEQNYAYVGGEGSAENRVIQEVYDIETVTISPWARKEVFVEARQQGNISALIASGNQELQNRKAKQTLSFNLRQTDSTRWIRDWNLGDLITANYYVYTFDKQITEIGVTVTSGSYESITATFNELRI